MQKAPCLALPLRSPTTFMCTLMCRAGGDAKGALSCCVTEVDPDLLVVGSHNATCLGHNYVLCVHACSKANKYNNASVGRTCHDLAITLICVDLARAIQEADKRMQAVGFTPAQI